MSLLQKEEKCSLKSNLENSHKATTYRFNGKEYDQETGNYYYGARYYDPKLSIWLSVDPMSSRDLGLTPYHFVKNNPIMLIDPTGLTWDPAVKDDADKLLGNIKSVKQDLIKDNQKLEGKIVRYQSKNWSASKTERKTGRVQDKIDRNNERISELDQSIQDWNDIDSDNQVYTFKNADSPVSESYTENGKVVMEHNSNMASKVHEMRHGGQHARGQITLMPKGMSPLFKGGGLSPLNMELQGYRAQWGFSPRSMPISINGGGYSPSSINKSYIQGLYFINDQGNRERTYPQL